MANQASAPSPPSLRKKLAFSLLATFGFFALLEGVLALAEVPIVNSLDDPYVGFASYSNLFVQEDIEQAHAMMTTAPGKLRWFNPQRFQRDKPPGTFRIFTLGGSTTYGRPYADGTSFASWLRELLPATTKTIRWEVINAGGISYASYRAARLMEELNRYDPDLYVIYSGHNEFLERRTYAALIAVPEPIRDASSVLGRTRTYSALHRLFHPLERAPTEAQRQLLPAEIQSILDDAVGPDSYARDDRLRDRIMDHYRFNLHRMVRMARSEGIRVILVVPASNLRDSSPFKSQVGPDTSPQERIRLQAHLASATAAARERNWQRVLDVVDPALSDQPRFAELHYLKGRASWALDLGSDAARAFVRARDEDVCPLRALTAMGDIVRQVAEREGVQLVDFERIVADESAGGVPGNDWFLDHVHPTIDGHRLLAEHVLRAMDRAGLIDASEVAQAAVSAARERIEARLDPRAHARALRDLSKVLGWAGKQEESRELALRVVKLVPGDPEAHYEAGNAYVELRRPEDAITEYERARELSPGSAKVLYGLGLAHELLGRTEEAIARFDEALELDPTFANAHYRLGRLHAAAERLDAAEEHFRHALDLNPNDHMSCNELGVIMARRGELAAAEGFFRRALQLKPDTAPALSNLAAIHRQRGDERTALQLLRQSLAADPDQFDATYELARLLLGAGDRALQDPERGLFWARALAERTHHGHPGVLAVLATALARTGQVDEALRWQRRAVEIAPAELRPGLEVELERLESRAARIREPGLEVSSP